MSANAPFVSGFCTPNNPRTKDYDPHQQCRGCDCTATDCHQTSGAEGAPDATTSVTEPATSAPELRGLHVLPDLIQGSDEWHDQRRGMVTASVVGQLVTPSTLKVASNDTARGLIASLVAERITGYTEASFMNADMERGVMHEPLARERYAEVNGVEVAEVGFMVRTFSGGQLGYSPDGLVGDDGLLEIKCPRAKTHLRTVIADEVPAYNMAQCQAGLLVAGRKWIDFVSFCAGQPMWTKRVHPDPKWQAVIAEAVALFEKAAEQMASDYLGAVAGLPATERVNDNLGLVF
jgi:hypothetical protein